MTASRSLRILIGLAGGAAAGVVFGAGFGSLAHVFAGGPPLLQGVLETVPFFALCGALGGAVLATEAQST